MPACREFPNPETARTQRSAALCITSPPFALKARVILAWANGPGRLPRYRERAEGQRYKARLSRISQPRDRTRTQGSATLCVIGNPHAEEFYEACDFHVIGTTETRFGLGLLMRKLV